MVTSVTPPVELGGSGDTYSDGNDPVTGMQPYGYAKRFFKLVADVIAMVQTAVTAAASALTAPGTSATSVTPMVYGAGSKTFTLVQTGKAFSKSQNVHVSPDAAPTLAMVGRITAFNAGTGVMTITVTALAPGAADTYSAWNIALEGAPGTSVPLVPEERSADTGALTLGDLGKTIKAINGYDQALDAAADAGEGTFVGFWNASGEICRLVADAGSSPGETVDGLAAISVYPGETFTLLSNGADGWVTLGRVRGGWVQVGGGQLASGATKTFLDSFDDPELDAWELTFDDLSATGACTLLLAFNGGSVAVPSWTNAAFWRQDFESATMSSATSNDLIGFSSGSDYAAGRVNLRRSGVDSRLFADFMAMSANGNDLSGKQIVAACAGLRLSLSSTPTFDGAGVWSLHARRRAL